jgi:hypothetical protein
MSLVLNGIRKGAKQVKHALRLAALCGACLVACDSSTFQRAWTSRTLDIRLEDGLGHAVQSYDLAVMGGEPSGATPWETSEVIGRNSFGITPSPRFISINNPEGRFELNRPHADVYTIHVRIDGTTQSTTVAVDRGRYRATPLHLRLDEDGTLAIKETAGLRTVEPRRITPPWEMFGACSIEVEVDESAGREVEIALLAGEPTGRTPWETQAGNRIIPGPPALMPPMNGRCWWKNLLPAEAYTFFVKYRGATVPLTVHLALEPGDAVRGVVRISEDGQLSFEETQRHKAQDTR